MRFFKYFIFIIYLFSFSLFAQEAGQWSGSGGYQGMKIQTWSGFSPEAACSSSYTDNGLTWNFSKLVSKTETKAVCEFYREGGSRFLVTLNKISIACPSATEKALKVPSNAGSYVCESQCQYMLTGCVDIPEEPGQTCSAISTGKVCSGPTNPNTGNTSPSPSTSNPGANANNDGSQTSTNSADSISNNTSTSTSTSNTTTTNNTTNNTSTSTTTTTTTTNNTTTTKTIIDLSSLENTINNVGKKIIDAINGLKDKDGSDTGSEDGDKDGTDLTETNKKLDDIKKSIDDGSEWAKKGEDDILPTGEQIAIPERTLEKKSFTENMFGTTAQCPANKTLSMSLLGAKSFSYTFDFSQWCYYLGLLGQLILIGAYLQGAHIITRNS